MKKWTTLTNDHLLRNTCHLQHFHEGRHIVNGQFAERLAVEGDLLLRECLDELRVTNAIGAECGVEAGDPQTAELALLATTVREGIYTGTNDCFVCFYERRGTHAAVPLGKLQDLLVTTVPNNTTFNAHGLESRDEGGEATKVTATGHDGAWETLLALALLLEEVTAATACEREFTTARLPKTFLGAAV